MPLSDEERFRFDLTGFLVRPGILHGDEVLAMREQVERIARDPLSLPPEHRAAPGGALSALVDHPQIADVLFDVIGPNVRMLSSNIIYRESGQANELGLHRSTDESADPVFGYRVGRNGRIYAGVVIVVVELTDIAKGDGATSFLVGSHKSNFPPHPDHLRFGESQSQFLASYECPAGSAVFFNEQLIHGGPVWTRSTPRIAMLSNYSHLAINHHLGLVPKVVIDGLPRERQAWFRQPYEVDFRRASNGGAKFNTIERFLEDGDEPLDMDAV